MPESERGLDYPSTAQIVKSFYWVGKRLEDLGQADQGITVYSRWTNECFSGLQFMWPYSTNESPRFPPDQIGTSKKKLAGL